MSEFGNKITYPLSLNQGTSRYHDGVTWYLVDSQDNMIASTSDYGRSLLMDELVATVNAMVEGEPVRVNVKEVATKIVTAEE